MKRQFSIQPPSVPPVRRRTLLALASAAGALATASLLGCASMGTLTMDVSSFGDWPADRKPGTYAFERLPSQEARLAQTQSLEALARPALAKAGFTPAPDGQAPDILVQVGSRMGSTDASPWADPLWWRGGFGRHHRHSPWGGPRWGMAFRHDFGRYENQVALLMRDRASGKPLFEAQASHHSSTELTSHQNIALMFEAALMDFPRLGMNPRSVVLPIR